MSKNIFYVFISKLLPPKIYVTKESLIKNKAKFPDSIV